MHDNFLKKKEKLDWKLTQVCTDKQDMHSLLSFRSMRFEDFLLLRLKLSFKWPSKTNSCCCCWKEDWKTVKYFKLDIPKETIKRDFIWKFSLFERYEFNSLKTTLYSIAAFNNIYGTWHLESINMKAATLNFTKKQNRKRKEIYEKMSLRNNIKSEKIFDSMSTLNRSTHTLKNKN